MIYFLSSLLFLPSFYGLYFHLFIFFTFFYLFHFLRERLCFLGGIIFLGWAHSWTGFSCDFIEQDSFLSGILILSGNLYWVRFFLERNHHSWAGLSILGEVIVFSTCNIIFIYTLRASLLLLMQFHFGFHIPCVVDPHHGVPVFLFLTAPSPICQNRK